MPHSILDTDHKMQSHAADLTQIRLCRLASTLVILLVCKNAALSAVLGRFGGQSGATLGWYGLAALFGVVVWATSHRGQFVQLSRWAARVMPWIGVGACAAMAWVQAVEGPADLPVSGYDWIALGCCFGLLTAGRMATGR